MFCKHNSIITKIPHLKTVCHALAWLSVLSGVSAFEIYFVDNMSYLTYLYTMIIQNKPIIWLHGEIKTPPFSFGARIEAGFLFRLLQKGGKLKMPHSRTMPSIGSNCHELRINDERNTWRIIYRIDNDAIIILEIFKKKTQQTPKNIIDICKKRIKEYDNE